MTEVKGNYRLNHRVNKLEDAHAGLLSSSIGPLHPPTAAPTLSWLSLSLYFVLSDVHADERGGSK